MASEQAALREARARRTTVILLRDGGFAAREIEAGAMVGWRPLDTEELLPVDAPHIVAAQWSGRRLPRRVVPPV